MTPHEYYSNGKLLLTAEYLVLNGAEALVLPLKKGQSLRIEEISDNGPGKINWKSYYKGYVWFDAEFYRRKLEIQNSSDSKKAEYLLKLLKTVRKFRPELFEKSESLKIESQLNFDPAWGFGSSSTLIVNIAKWAQINPFQLFFSFTCGSGYDIAAAFYNHPFIYRIRNNKPLLKPLTFSPALTNNLYFVYLGRKQDSEPEVRLYIEKHVPSSSLIKKATQLTHDIVNCHEIDRLNLLIFQHELMISELIKREPVKNTLFPDFTGSVKSLGAWGGDFALFSSTEGKEKLMQYLIKKGIEICFTFDELVLQNYHNPKILTP